VWRLAAAEPKVTPNNDIKREETAMTVYVVVDNVVHNPDEYKKYLALITPTVTEFGGHYVVRAGKIHMVDSEWKPDRLVIMTFPTAEQAVAWAESPLTAPIHAMRRANATTKMLIIDGTDAA